MRTLWLLDSRKLNGSHRLEAPGDTACCLYQHISAAAGQNQTRLILEPCWSPVAEACFYCSSSQTFLLAGGALLGSQTQTGSINNSILPVGRSESYPRSQVAGGSSLLLDPSPLQGRDQAVERPGSSCSEKRFCPFLPSSLTCALPDFILVFVVQACDGLSAMRAGGCFRQVEKEAGGEHPDERSCGL